MFSFFTAKIMAYLCAALGVVVIGLSLALWAQDVRLGKAQNDRDKARNQVAEALKTISGYQTAVEQCNEGTRMLKLVAAQKSSEADQALLRARTEAARYQEANKRRNTALRAPTPPGAGCAQALASIRESLPKP